MVRLSCSGVAVALAAAALALAHAPGARAADDVGRPFCADRPGKATPPCTLEPGRVQVELDAVDWMRDREAGATATVLSLASPTVKVGLTPASELQFAWTPYERAAATGAPAVSSVGDAFLRLKWNLTHNDPNLGVALLPYVKLPTARRGLGDGKVEEGLVVPTALALAGGWTLGASPEVDLLANDSGAGRHMAAAVAAGLGHPLSSTLTAGAEVWVERDFVGHAASLATADFLLAWTPAGLKDVQLDAGVNLGLTRASANLQAYAGVSKRF